MPRLSPSLILKARSVSSNLLPLLPVCRSLEQAKQELKWIQNELPRSQWDEAIVKRSRFVPLQYILGSQPFGDLEIRCKEKVLIPRWETEEWCLKLIEVLKTNNRKDLKILDVCTGSGCIPLLVGSKLSGTVIKGVDVSKDCIDLSNENKKLNSVGNVDFKHGDVFKESTEEFDLITSNPPYIPMKYYTSGEVERSVRLYEPKLALVGDLEFYKALVENIVIPSKANGFIFELGYEYQYEYTKTLLDQDRWTTGLLWDSNKKPRCVVGWKNGSELESLSKILT